mmetsp:Transcript_108370/g.288398  ORF Transcript_108370/g.288398 Transcript_108370/m.288398 type:complete len:278 (-) Transcript_108370:188-1021(-)
MRASSAHHSYGSRNRESQLLGGCRTNRKSPRCGCHPWCIHSITPGLLQLLLPQLLLSPPLLEDLGCPRVTPLHIAQGFQLLLVLQKQPLLHAQLLQLVGLRGGALEDEVVGLPVALGHQPVPPLLHVIADAILLVNALVLGHKVDGKGAALQLPGPSLLAIALCGGQLVDVALPLSAHLVLLGVALRELHAHDLGGLLARPGAHLQPPQQSLPLLGRGGLRQGVRHAVVRHLGLVIDKVLIGRVSRLPTEQSFMLPWDVVGDPRPVDPLRTAARGWR